MNLCSRNKKGQAQFITSGHFNRDVRQREKGEKRSREGLIISRRATPRRYGQSTLLPG